VAVQEQVEEVVAVELDLELVVQGEIISARGITRAIDVLITLLLFIPKNIFLPLIIDMLFHHMRILCKQDFLIQM
jgi:hypothetical protein